MEGLAQAVQLIQETAVLAESAEVHDLHNPRKTYVQLKGSMLEYDKPPAPRDHHVNALADLIAYVAAVQEGNAVVWHGPAGVVAVLDDDDRLDTVTFSLTFSDRLRKLMELAKNKPTFDQQKFVRLLRIDLGLDNETVVKKFRKLKWSGGNTADGDAFHGNVRVSKEVSAKVEKIDDLPEEQKVPVPIYQQFGERQEYDVKCAVEIDPVNQTFQLVPLPDEIERVVDLHQADIRQRLDAELSNPVYFGHP